MPDIPLPTRISKMLEADVANAPVAAFNIGALDPWALDAFDSAADLFRGLSERLHEWPAEAKVNDALLAIADGLGMTGAEAAARLQAKDPALDEAARLYRRMFTFERIRIVVAASQRYWAWGASDLFRFRLSPAVGSLRLLAEALALITLFWHDDDLAAEWFGIQSGSDGKAFFRKTQPDVMKVLEQHQVAVTYGIASSVAQHVRMAGIVRNLDTSNGIRLPDQDVGADLFSFHLVVAHFHRIIARLLPAIGALLLDPEDSWHAEARGFTEQAARLWGILETKYRAEIASTAELDGQD